MWLISCSALGTHQELGEHWLSANCVLDSGNVSHVQGRGEWQACCMQSTNIWVLSGLR